MKRKSLEPVLSKTERLRRSRIGIRDLVLRVEKDDHNRRCVEQEACIVPSVPRGLRLICVWLE
jgi:hypothetical protein